MVVHQKHQKLSESSSSSAWQSIASILETRMPDEIEFREEVREFLAEKFTPQLKAAAKRGTGVYADYEVAMEWHRILYEKGWIAPAWPSEFGGTGWTASQKLTFEVECALAGTPVLPAMSLQMCAPVLMKYGTPEQRERFLPRILSGEDYWCQGYSEPSAGSDLASLKCRAVREGDVYVVNGSKIWTTHAHLANWMFLLVRTDTESKPQAGITFLLTPMDALGISVTPILNMSGEHEFNQVFLDDVKVPIANRVGQENEGWTIAKHLLEFERGGIAATARPIRVLSLMYELAAEELAGTGQGFWQDPFFGRRVAELEIEMMAVDALQRSFAVQGDSHSSVGDSAAAIIKLKAAECYQTVTELAMDQTGPVGMVDQMSAGDSGGGFVGSPLEQTPTTRYLNGRAMSIFGGAAEILKTLIARSALKS